MNLTIQTEQNKLVRLFFLNEIATKHFIHYFSSKSFFPFVPEKEGEIYGVELKEFSDYLLEIGDPDWRQVIHYKCFKEFLDLNLKPFLVLKYEIS